MIILCDSIEVNRKNNGLFEIEVVGLKNIHIEFGYEINKFIENADVDWLLEEIGEERVKKYFGIE